MQPLSWYLNRLSLMSAGEMVWRATGAAAARLADGRSVAASPSARSAAVQLPRWPVPVVSVPPYLDAAERVLAGEVDLYGSWIKATSEGTSQVDWNSDPVSRTRAPLQYGKRLDYRDSRLVGSARNTWEVNRHFQLVTLAQAYALSGEERFRSGAQDLLSSWLSACPYPLGINWASSLEHGIRLINWYMAARLLQLDASRPVEGWLDSIYRHCDFIWRNRSRYSSANNHLIGEMTGLYMAASAWGCWEASAEWRRNAKEILEREAREQVWGDGVGKEQTVGYQIFVLQFLLAAGLTGERHGDPFSPEYWAVVRRMIGFLRSIVNAEGHLPDFGDSDDGIAYLLSPSGRLCKLADLLELDAVFSRQSTAAATIDGAAAWILAGFPVPRSWPAGLVAPRRDFPEGGYFVLGHRFGRREEVSLVFDAAPLGYLSIAAHGHADCLSFVLSLGGEQILIDPGTYCYHSDPIWRDYFRSTAAHNTVRVDGTDQSQMGGPFMWLRKAKPTVEAQDFGGSVQRIRARHDGYGKLSDPVIHTRELSCDTQGAAISISDEIAARGAHTVERFWHFSDACEVRLVGKTGLVVEAQRSVVEFTFENADELRLHRGSTEPRSGWLSRNFGALLPTTTAVVTTRCAGTAALRSTIKWRAR